MATPTPPPPAPALVVLAIAACCGGAFAQPASGDEDPFVAEVAPFFARFCLDCHTGDASESGVDLSRPVTLAEAQQNRSRWNQIRGLIELRAMPPADHDPLPDAQQIASITARLDELVNHVDCQVEQDPGGVTMRRLNAVEYDNTVRDLLRVDFKPSGVVGLPSDDVGNGFDNQGEVLTSSPLLIEKYLQAAREITDRVVLEASADREAAAAGAELFVARPGKELSPREALGRVFGGFLPRAYRRPVEPIEVERLVSLAAAALERGESFEEAVALGVQAVLVSPHFLFRVEPAVAGGSPAPLGAHQLASRLSYFLWASMPDDELFAAARSDSLGDERSLARQVHRMLADPRADMLVTRFFAQWLGLTGLDAVAPDPDAFPIWNDKLSRAAREETLMLCRTVLSEDRSLLDLFDADFTFVNPRLAELYGLNFLGQDPRELYLNGPGFPQDRQRRGRRRTREAGYLLEDRWMRVRAPDGRRGVMTHASVLALTSNPDETSPVKRGRWVLDTVLGASPPPAPPSVPSIEETAAGAEGRSFRERLAVHRENPSCAGCHAEMDPIGLGLQNFDPIGRWRTRDGGRRIDASGVLDGEAFDGPAGLMEVVRRREDDIVRNFVRRLMTYALGRGLTPADECAVDDIVAEAKPGYYQVAALIEGVALSRPFRMLGAAPDGRPPVKKNGQDQQRGLTRSPR